MKKATLSLFSLILVACTGLTSCGTYGVGHPDPYVRHGRRGGALVGAGVGAVIGNNVRGGNSWGGAAIGGAVGGLAGGHRGRYRSSYYRGGYGSYGGHGYRRHH